MARPYDVFISYTHADKAALKPLIAALDAAGLRYFLDDNVLEDQASITRRIVEGLGNSRLFLAWYSETYPTRRACQWELTAAYLAAAQRQDDASAVRRRLRIINPEPGVEHILPKDLLDGLMKPTDQMSWRDRVAALQEALKQVPETFGHLGAFDRPLWRLGNEHTGSGRFVGRQKDLWALHGGLHKHRLAVVAGLPGGSSGGLVQVQGMGGVGKTLLAQEYALRYGRAYPGGIFWLTAGDSADIALAGVALALALPADQGPEHTRAAIKAKLQADGQAYLWVVDDLPTTVENADLVQWRAPTPHGYCLITTRSTRLRDQGYEHRLDQLDDQAALDLLTHRRKPLGDEERLAKEIVKRLGNHALAVDVAGALCVEFGYADFLAQLDNTKDDVLADLAEELADALPTGCSANIAKTLGTSLNRLPPESLSLLTLASLLDAAPIPDSFLKAVFTKHLGDAGQATISLAKARKGAGWEALTERLDATAQTESSLSVHILISRVVQRQQRAEAGPLRAAALAVLLELFDAHATDIRQHGPLLPLLPHARVLTADASDEAAADLLGWIGRVEFGRGLFAQAKATLTRTVEARTTIFGPEHPDTLTSMNNLASTLRAMGDLQGAKTLHEQVLDLRRRILGPEHPDTLTSMNNLALTLWDMGDLQGAKTLEEQVLDLRRRILGPEHPDTLTSMNNLAGTLRALGDLQGAKTLQEQELDLCRRILGPEHPSTLTSMNNLAQILRALGDLQGAKTLQEQVLDLSRRILGPEHPNTLASMHNLAQTHLALNQRSAALALVTEALPIALHKHGPNLPITKALQKRAIELGLDPTPAL